MKYEVWDVKIRFSRDGRRGNWESGINAGWPKGTTALEVIADVVRQRDIDASTIIGVDATKLDLEYDR